MLLLIRETQNSIKNAASIGESMVYTFALRVLLIRNLDDKTITIFRVRVDKKFHSLNRSSPIILYRRSSNSVMLTILRGIFFRFTLEKKIRQLSIMIFWEKISLL